MADASEPVQSQLRTPRPTLARRLRLFLSADIVGSTAFKQRYDGEGSKWFDTVGSFYRQASALLTREWGIALGSREAPDDRLFGKQPELWKTIGDEVLFVKDIEHAPQAVMCLQVWCKTLQQLRDFLAKDELDVKSTAWLADFPTRNRVVIFKNENEDDTDYDFAWRNDQLMQAYEKNPRDYTRDFIGPSIDVGFRLGASASPRLLVLSVELAHLLSGEECRGDEVYRSGPYEIPRFNFRYEGRQLLKGVMNGTPYPLICIDTSPSKPIHQAEDELLGRIRPSCQDIHAFTSAFVSEQPNKVCTGLEFALSRTPSPYQAHCEAIDQHIADEERRYCKFEETSTLREDASKELDEAPTSASTVAEVMLPN
jgi:hypothetical protein